MRYLLIVCLTIGLTASADISKDAIRKAYFETFAVRLNDSEAAADSGNSHPGTDSSELSFPPIDNLPPFPGYQWLAVDDIGWHAAVLAAVVCLGGFAVDSLLRFRRRWREPQAVRLRNAKACLRRFAQDDSGSSIEDVTEALRTVSGMPPGTSLTAVAERLTPRHQELAEACRTFEKSRFSATEATTTSAAIEALKRALRIGIPCLVCLLAGCEGITQFAWYSEWSQGRLLASQGKLREAAMVFEKLSTVMPSCEALSETMAKLRTAIPSPHGDTAAAWQLHAKILHDSRIFSRRFAWLNYLPELALPVVTASLLIGIVACIRRRRLLATFLIGWALIVAISAAFPLSKRLSISSQAIAFKELRRTPDDAGEPLTTAGAIRVTLLSTTADGAFQYVKTAHAEGWIAADTLLKIKQ